MGRRRKPKDMQKAHLTQAEKERREEEERTVSTGNEQLKTPPEWLFNRTAKAEWKYLKPTCLILSPLCNSETEFKQN